MTLRRGGGESKVSVIMMLSVPKSVCRCPLMPISVSICIYGCTACSGVVHETSQIFSEQHSNVGSLNPATMLESSDLSAPRSKR